MNIFVTGTDTDIGKTVVSTILATGLDGFYWKPVQSGKECDSSFVKKFLPEKRVFPECYALSHPLSPHLAARLDGVEISLGSIRLPSCDGPLVVEGAGGVLVPLNDRLMIIDLIKKLGLPALLVARSSLGTINHTLLSVQALRSYSIPVLGVVMVGEKNLENKAAIEKYGQTRVLLEVEPLKQFNHEVFSSIYQKSHFSELYQEGVLWN